ncbi:MAG: AbrB/MazE/SpoVT family DNA-binding domain-containing protein [Candidatus Eremiobacteraeota bacterium]|nr:AbrB/MazE/SpoVT family DNA-binding domain-containing protein [Candidatus Eremiobacteraeota bacterium]
MPYVKVTAKRQVTFSKAIFEKMGIQQGDLLEVNIRNNEVIELKAAPKTLRNLRGSAKVTAPQDFKKIREYVLDEVAEEAGLEGTDH